MNKNDSEQIVIKENAKATLWECIEKGNDFDCRWEEPITLEIGSKYKVIGEGPKKWDLAITLD